MSEARNQSIDSQLQKIAEFIRTRSDDILKGEDAAIKEMEKVVVGFCKHASTFPPDELQSFKEDIEFLSEYLNRIAVHLNLRREDVVQQLEDLNSRRKAAVAYKSAGRKGDK